MAVLQNVQQIAQGVARIQNILQYNDVAAGNVLGQVLGDLDLAAGAGAAAVGGHRHKIHGAGKLQRPAQVSHKDKGPAQYANQHNLSALIVRLNLPGNSLYPLFELLLTK